jgi:hypothetical protein
MVTIMFHPHPLNPTNKEQERPNAPTEHRRETIPSQK